MPFVAERPDELRDTPHAFPPGDLPSTFRRAVASFGAGPGLVLAHNDADGLSAAAVLTHALHRSGRESRVRIVGRGENAWSRAMSSELSAQPVGGVIVADLGVRAAPVPADAPLVVIDHHVPQGDPPGATVISGFGLEPIPTSSLLAFRCAAAIAKVDDLLWLAALGVIGDMAEASGFPEMQAARERYGVTALRKVASLINQPRRSASGDAAPALSLLLKAEGPKDVLSGKHPETALLLSARDEVKAELERARKVAPRIVGDVALIRFASPCQIHPLVAQTWTGRLKDRIVMAANMGFRAGWVHFAVRSATKVDLVAYLREHAPPGADELYGGGHAAASGGALRTSDWNLFVRSLGFAPEMEVPE